MPTVESVTQHDIERLVEHAGRGGKHTHLAGYLSSRQMTHEAHLPGETETASHCAANLGRDAERHRRRVWNEDGLDAASVGELECELTRAVDRLGIGHYPRRDHLELFREPGAQVFGEIGHRVEDDDTSSINPAVELSSMEAFATALFERALELLNFQLCHVQT